MVVVGREAILEGEEEEPQPMVPAGCLPMNFTRLWESRRRRQRSAKPRCSRRRRQDADVSKDDEAEEGCYELVVRQPDVCPPDDSRIDLVLSVERSESYRRAVKLHAPVTAREEERTEGRRTR